MTRYGASALDPSARRVCEQSTAQRARSQRIAEELRQGGLEVDCRPAREVNDIASYDAIVLGSAVYMKRWQYDARRLLRHHAPELSSRPLWVFSSGPFGERPDPTWAEPQKVVDALERLGAHERVVFGGRLPLEPSGFIEKAMVRDTPPNVADLRDWADIRSWASTIAPMLNASRALRPAVR